MRRRLGKNVFYELEGLPSIAQKLTRYNPETKVRIVCWDNQIIWELRVGYIRELLRRYGCTLSIREIMARERQRRKEKAKMEDRDIDAEIDRRREEEERMRERNLKEAIERQLEMREGV